MMEEVNLFSSSDEEDDDEFISNLFKEELVGRMLRSHPYARALRLINENRYLEERISRQKRVTNYLEWLKDQTPTVFTRQVRMPTMEAFQRLCDRIKHHEVYLSKGPKKQRSVEFQAAIVLYRLGLSGAGSSADNVSAHCGIAVGSVTKYTERFFTAILSLTEQWVYWPDDNEKEVIKAAIKKDSGFPNCIGFVDGSLIPLEFQPSWDRYQEFYTRKANYSIQTMCICDNKRRVRYIATGLFGSIHDSRVFNETMGESPGLYFNEGEYMLADSAYAATSFMVPPYKQPRDSDLSSSKKNSIKLIQQQE